MREAPGFPEGQCPFHCERDEHCVDRLVLAAIPKDEETRQEVDFAAPNTGTVETQDEYLDLRLCFKEMPNEQHIKQLGEELKRLIQLQKIKVHNVRWIGFPNFEKARSAGNAWFFARKWLSTIRRDTKPAMAISESQDRKTHMAQQVQIQTPNPSPGGTSEESDSRPEHAVLLEVSGHLLNPKDQIGAIKRSNDQSVEAESPRQSRRRRLR